MMENFSVVHVSGDMVCYKYMYMYILCFLKFLHSKIFPVTV